MDSKTGFCQNKRHGIGVFSEIIQDVIKYF